MSYYPDYITEENRSSVENILSRFDLKKSPFRIWDSSGNLLTHSVPLPSMWEGQDDKKRRLLIDFGGNIYINGELVIFLDKERKYKERRKLGS